MRLTETEEQQAVFSIHFEGIQPKHRVCLSKPLLILRSAAALVLKVKILAYKYTDQTKNKVTVIKERSTLALFQPPCHIYFCLELHSFLAKIFFKLRKGVTGSTNVARAAP